MIVNQFIFENLWFWVLDAKLNDIIDVLNAYQPYKHNI